MKFRVEQVTSRKQIRLPDNWKIEYIHPWQVKDGTPRFSVFLSQDTANDAQRQKESAIGFDLSNTLEDC